VRVPCVIEIQSIRPEKFKQFEKSVAGIGRLSFLGVSKKN